MHRALDTGSAANNASKKLKGDTTDLEGALTNFVDNAGWTKKRRMELLKRICQNKYILPVHAKLLICICDLLDKHSRVDEINSLFEMVKSNARWVGIDSETALCPVEQVVANAMLLLVGKYSAPLSRIGTNQPSSNWQRVLRWVYPHVSEDRKKEIYELMVNGLAKNCKCEYLLALGAMPIQEKHRSVVLNAFIHTCCFLTHASVWALHQLTDVAKQLRLKMNSIKCNSIEEAVYGDAPVPEEAAINCYVRFACLVSRYGKCDGMGMDEITKRVLTMMIEVFQSMTHSGASHKRFLYDQVSDTLHDLGDNSSFLYDAITDMVVKLEEEGKFHCKEEVAIIKITIMKCKTTDNDFYWDCDSDSDDDMEKM